MEQLSDSKTYFASPLTIVVTFLAIVFFCSFLYDYAFFRGIGLDLTTMPMSTQEIVSSAFSWLPKLFGIIFFYCVIYYIISRYSTGIVPNETNHDHSLRKKISSYPYYIITAFFILMFLDALLFSQNMTFKIILLFISGSFIWLKIGLWLSETPVLNLNHHFLIKISIIYLPILVGLMLTLGYKDANAILNRNNAEIIIKDNLNQVEQAVVIRLINAGILYKPLFKDQILYQPWDKIANVEFIHHRKYYSGLLCNKLHICTPF